MTRVPLIRVFRASECLLRGPPAANTRMTRAASRSRRRVDGAGRRWRDGHVAQRGRRAAHDELGAEQVLAVEAGRAVELLEQQLAGVVAHGEDRLAHGGERRVGVGHQRAVVVADHRPVARHVAAPLAGAEDRAERHQVARRHDGRRAGVEQRPGGRAPTLDREHRVDDEGIVDVGADLGQRLPVAVELALHDDVAGRAADEPDPAVPERREVVHGERRGAAVVARHARGRRALGVAVDEHHRHALGDQLVVRRLVALGVGVATGHDDDAGDAALDERAEVLELVDDLRRAAEHARVAGGGQTPFERLGEHREHRVVELRHDDADEPGLERARPHEARPAELVDGAQDDRPGPLAHPRLAVHDPADRGLAHPRELGDLSPAHTHGGHRSHPPCARLARNARTLLPLQPRAALPAAAYHSRRGRCTTNQGGSMRTATFRVTALSLLAACSLIAASCGGDDDDDAGSGATAATTATAESGATDARGARAPPANRRARPRRPSPTRARRPPSPRARRHRPPRRAATPTS